MIVTVTVQSYDVRFRSAVRQSTALLSNATAVHDD